MFYVHVEAWVATNGHNGKPTEGYSRREALAALAKYSAAIGGASVTIISADGLVSAAAAGYDNANPNACIRGNASFCPDNAGKKGRVKL